MQEYCKVLEKAVLGRFLYQEPMKRHTTFQIGGVVPLLLFPKDCSNLQRALQILDQEGISFRLLGNGSNLLVGDDGLPDPVISLKDIRFIKKISWDSVRAGAGISLPALASWAQGEGLTGLEFLTNIPGTLGGGLIMNAGLKEEWLGDRVDAVVVFDASREKRVLKKEAFSFGYRQSSLRDTSSIIVEAQLRLTAGSPGEIQERMERLGRERRENQPHLPSAGSVFKNPGGGYAGQLIDACGLKGKAMGGAVVSEKHANFIVNRGGAEAADVLALVRLIQEEVWRVFGIQLELEMEVW